MTTTINATTNPPEHVCEHLRGTYHYTDGRIVSLCPMCDAPHADELLPVVSEHDARQLEYAAGWLVDALGRAHGRFDLVYDAVTFGQNIGDARTARDDVRNPAVSRRVDALIVAVRQYGLEYLGRRLEADRAGAVAHAATMAALARPAAVASVPPGTGKLTDDERRIVRSHAARHGKKRGKP